MRTHAKAKSSYLRSGQVKEQSIMVMELWATETPWEFFTRKLYIFSWGWQNIRDRHIQHRGAQDYNHAFKLLYKH